MNKRKFAATIALNEGTAILGAPIAEWNKTLTEGFVAALPTVELAVDTQAVIRARRVFNVESRHESVVFVLETATENAA